MSQMTADTILCNGKVLTVDKDFSIAEAVAIKDGLVAAVGTNDQISKWWGTELKEIDLAGKTVIPGIIDGHPHLAVEGLRYVYRSLAGAQSIDDVLKVIATEVATRRPGDWIVTAPVGDPPFYQDVPGNLRENRFPNRHDLDKVAPDNPVYIKPIWSWWNKPPVVSIANSAALRLAGITRDTKAPYPGITIEKDATGEPTGVIIEDAPSGILHAAQDFSLMRVAPRFTYEDRIKAFRHSLKKFNSVGTTSIYEGHGVVPEVMQVYRDYWARDELTVRSYLVVSPPPQKSIAEYDEFMREWAVRARGTGVGEAMLKIGGVNIVWGGDLEVARLRAQELALCRIFGLVRRRDNARAVSRHGYARGQAWTPRQHDRERAGQPGRNPPHFRGGQCHLSDQRQTLGAAAPLRVDLAEHCRRCDSSELFQQYCRAFTYGKQAQSAARRRRKSAGAISRPTGRS